MNTAVELENRDRKEVKFYTAKIDAIFKTIFVQENDHHMMEALLSECLNEEVSIVKYSKVELDVKRSKERTKRLDVLVRVKDKYLNIELNTNNDHMTRVRNFNFFTAFYSSKTNRGDSYDSEIEYIQINLSFNMPKTKEVITTYEIKNDYGEKYVKNFKIMEINMDKIKEEWYHNGKKGSKYQYLLMLDLDKKELKELSKSNDKIVKEYMKKVVELNSDVFVPPVSYEEDEQLILEAYKKEARREGIKEEKYNTARKLLSMNVDIQIIKEATGLAKEEIEKLKKSSK